MSACSMRALLQSNKFCKRTLDNLLDIKVAYSLLRGANEDGDKDLIDINYEKL